MNKALLPLLLAFASATAQAISEPAPTWLAVSGNQGLENALEPLVEHRRSQGFEVVTETGSVEEAIATLGSAPDYLLIIGDDQLVKAKRGSQYRWLSTQNESFAADPLFSDLDDDGIPNFPVGRLPVGSPAQLAAVVAKIIAYENRVLDISDLNLPVWSGTPAYGKLLDETADWLLMSTIRKYAPTWAQTWLITANSNNTLNAWPTDQARLFNTQIQMGAAFTAMMGHGSTDLFLSMQRPGADIVYTNSDARGLDDPTKISPPLVIFACDCGNFAHPRKKSLAATLLLGRGGPVATIAATTESHPLTNYYSSIALMQALASPPPAARVGDLWLAAQHGARQMRKPLIERLLKNVEGSLETEIDIPKLKMDQMQMYAYLGDPALAISLPEELEVSITSPAEGQIAWSATIPEGAQRLVVQILRPTPPLRSKPENADRELSLQLFSQRNAQFTYDAITELPANGTVWTGEVTAPGDLRLVALSKDRIWVATRKIK